MAGQNRDVDTLFLIVNGFVGEGQPISGVVNRFGFDKFVAGEIFIKNLALIEHDRFKHGGIVGVVLVDGIDDVLDFLLVSWSVIVKHSGEIFPFLVNDILGGDPGLNGSSIECGV